MRLCSVCDKKVEGNWCKNCHRFVKSYQLPGRIYLNERHDAANDSGCTYHTADNGNSAEPSYTTSGTEKTYTSARTYTATASSTATSTATSTTTGTQKKTAKNTGKIAAVIIVLYVVIIIVRAVFAFVGDEALEELGTYIEQYVGGETENTPQDISGEVDNFARNVVLQGLSPEKVIQEDEYSIMYYTPEDIMELNYPCDNQHFPMTYTEFEKWLQKNWMNGFETEEECISDYNYCYEDEFGLWVQFSSYRYYYADNDFGIRVDYDTATGQLHAFGFVSTTDAGNPELCYALLKKLDSKTDWTQEQMTEKLNTALEGEEGYLDFYYSEDVEILFERNGNVFSLIYYPVYLYE